LLSELHINIPKASVVYCDNISAVYMPANPVHHRRTKHVELDVHFVREKVALGQFKVVHVPTQHQFADIMTKGLPTVLFEEFRDSLSIKHIDASTERGVATDDSIHSVGSWRYPLHYSSAHAHVYS
jgi:hypothetical protein